MSEVLHGTDCCAVNEIGSLSDFSNAKEAVKAVCRDIQWGDMDCAFITFTQASGAKGERYRYGSNLARYVKAHGLGDVSQSPMRVNPNTGNRVRVYIWAINRSALDKWSCANGIDKDEVDDEYDPYQW